MLRVLKKKQFWGGLIGLALLAFCLKDIKAAEIRSLLERISYLQASLAILLSFVFIFLRALRWRIMVTRQTPVSIARSVTLYAAGQVLNIVMPVLTGQVGRLILFSRKLGLRKTFVFSTVLLEVLFDAVSLILFMAFTSLAFAFPKQYRDVSLIVGLVTLAVLIALYIMLHYQRWLEECGRRRLARRWPGVYVTLKKSMRSFAKGLELLKSSQHMVGTILYSLASWTGHMFVIYFLYRSFGFHLPIAAAAALMIINTIVLMIPITPGNAGTFEVAVSTSLAAFSVGRTDAVLFALALHLLDLLPIVTIGLFFFHFEKVSLREIKARHQDEIIFEKITEEGTFVDDDHN
ncbi:MAG TPA: lysylphosphatidylglycerol synthase transmembrane domain-containing protein [Candidatus Acidoferrum sp.]|nr:lysylphosphatidylglycerol synthase transmembrane domain-containing protein [Candidatus Acidoferrum sp.]